MFNAIYTIIDTSIGDDDASQVKAYMQNTSINAAGNITIDATMDATFTALIENAATRLSTSLGDSETMSIAPISA